MTRIYSLHVKRSDPPFVAYRPSAMHHQQTQCVNCCIVLSGHLLYFPPSCSKDGRAILVANLSRLMYASQGVGVQVRVCRCVRGLPKSRARGNCSLHTCKAQSATLWYHGRGACSPPPPPCCPSTALVQAPLPGETVIFCAVNFTVQNVSVAKARKTRNSSMYITPPNATPWAAACNKVEINGNFNKVTVTVTVRLMVVAMTVTVTVMVSVLHLTLLIALSRRKKKKEQAVDIVWAKADRGVWKTVPEQTPC